MKVVVGGRIIFSLSGYQAIAVLLFLTSPYLKAQDQTSVFSDSVTVRECITYALKNQPLVSQSKIDEQIAEKDIQISLSDWYPQISSSAMLQHYIKQPVSIFPNFSDPTAPKMHITTGVVNNSNIQFNANQKIFSSDLIFAGRTAKYYRQQAGQSTRKVLIQLVVNVRKAFYDVLLTQQMLDLINDDIERLTKSLKDALSMYNNGVTDKTDYSRATISLNTARSQKISITNSIIEKITYLKQLMGYPQESGLAIKSSFNEMRQEAMIDTLQPVKYNDRIEFQLLQTELTLGKLAIGYYRQSLLPTLSGNATYNINYQNDNFGDLYNNSFPNSFVGLSLSFPLFEGTKRIQNIRKSRLEYNRLVLDTH